jgi:chemotaxis family two-component system sensor kinase Cph1
VLQFAQILEQRCKPANEEDVKDFALITRAIGRMETLIDDILCYARVSRSDSQPRIPTVVQHALQASLANLQRDIAETGAVVTYEGLPTLEVDASQLLQLFQNLIGNAIRYRSVERPRIHVSSLRGGENWLFAIRDNGIGIQPEYHESIFKPFKRLHGSERPGSGIGLAICRKIIERHQGRIWVESQPSKGSTFYFTLRA